MSHMMITSKGEGGCEREGEVLSCWCVFEVQLLSASLSACATASAPSYKRPGPLLVMHEACCVHAAVFCGQSFV